MRIESSKPNISDYGFLRLFTSTIILHGEVPIFENKQLQKDLYGFYDNPDFHFLFEDICKKESIEENNYVDLGNALQLAYAWGLLSMIQDSSNLKSVINLSEEEAQENISQFESHQSEAMNELVTQLYDQKKVNKPQVLVKSKNIYKHAIWLVCQLASMFFKLTKIKLLSFLLWE